MRRNLSEGKSPMIKHGYKRDENGLYRPDDKNFDLIVKAWKMRKDGKSIEEIVKYMNDQGYKRIIQSTQKVVDMDKRILIDIFHDPFYYGVLIQASKKWIYERYMTLNQQSPKKSMKPFSNYP